VSQCVIDEIVEHDAAENGVVSTRRQPQDVADRERHGRSRVIDRAPGDINQRLGPVDPLNRVTPPRQLHGVAARPTPGIEECGARNDAAVDQPGDDRAALPPDRAVDQQVEGPTRIRCRTVARSSPTCL
jgi:hypothetical protein